MCLLCDISLCCTYMIIFTFLNVCYILTTYKNLILCIKKQKEHLKQIQPLTFQLAPCHRHSHKSLNRLHSPSWAAGTRHGCKCCSSRPLKTDLRAHPVSGISNAVALSKVCLHHRSPEKHCHMARLSNGGA